MAPIHSSFTLLIHVTAEVVSKILKKKRRHISTHSFSEVMNGQYIIAFIVFLNLYSICS
jgi:hypothetical protein